MRYRLRTLLIVSALGPPVLAGAWLAYSKWRHEAEHVIGVPIGDWGLHR